MTLAVAYVHDRSSREPRPMTTQQIWGVADQVRRQLAPGRSVVCLDLERLIRAAGRMMINGIAIATHWDFERSVQDGRGREALGVTEADPALPDIVLISLNAKLIAERDYLKRSTLAHEFGHAVFDGPSMLRQAGKPAFAMVTPDEGHLETAVRGRNGMDWREFRANEFMGALLVPRLLLHRELVRHSIALGLALRDAGESQPVLDKKSDPSRVEGLLIDLGERFGVSATFIEYRLHRYGLVH
jgi:Zn-dependent peptidase ImmA (M78 family)